MNEIELRFGGQVLKLNKAPDAIAIKPRRNVERTARARTHPALVNLEKVTEPALAGFKVLNIEPARMENTLDELRDSPAVAAGAHVYHTSADGVPFVPTGEIYVRWKPGATKAEKDGLLREHKLTVQETRGEETAVLRITSNSPNPLKVAAALQKSEAVAVAEPDLATPGVLHSTCSGLLPTDPLLDQQWHLRNTGANS